jgi:hypothetical protein
MRRRLNRRVAWPIGPPHWPTMYVDGAAVGLTLAAVYLLNKLARAVLAVLLAH